MFHAAGNSLASVGRKGFAIPLMDYVLRGELNQIQGNRFAEEYSGLFSQDNIESNKVEHGVTQGEQCWAFLRQRQPTKYPTYVILCEL